MKRLTCVGPRHHRRRSSLTSLTRRPSPARRSGSAMSGSGMEFLFLCSICSIVTIYRGNIGFKWDVPSSIWFVQMLGEEAYLEQRRGFSNIALLQYNCYSSGLLLFSRIHRIIKIWRQMWTFGSPQYSERRGTSFWPSVLMRLSPPGPAGLESLLRARYSSQARPALHV